MTIFDLALLIIILGFVINGLFKGFIKMVGAILGFFIGVYVAGQYYVDFFNWFSGFISGNEGVLRITSFIILFFISAQIVALIFILIEKLFKLAAFLPGSRLINNLLGAVFGFVQGAMLMSLIVYVFSKYLDFGGKMSELLLSSSVAPLLLEISGIFTPLLPEALKSLSSFL